jgi:hypothetical protein
MRRKPFPILFGAFLLILFVAWFVRSRPGPQELSQSEFITLVNSNLLANIQIHHPPTPGMLHGVPVMLHRVRGKYYASSARNLLPPDQEISEQRPFFASVQISDEVMRRLMQGTKVSIVTPNSVIQKTAEFLHLRKS